MGQIRLKIQIVCIFTPERLIASHLYCVICAAFSRDYLCIMSDLVVAVKISIACCHGKVFKTDNTNKNILKSYRMIKVDTFGNLSNQSCRQFHNQHSIFLPFL